MYFSFAKDEENIPACVSQAGMRYEINRDPAFRNRDFRFWKDWFLFDGYSHWFRGDSPLPESETYTVSLSFLPATYASRPDGLFSCYGKQKGMEILLGAGGVITVNLSLGRFSLSFSSIRAHAKMGECSAVSVVYRGDAGWCDLYVNGILSSRKQFPRHTVLTFPETMPYLGRRVDGEFLTEDKPFSCFYGYMQWLEIDCCAKSEEEILALHKTIPSGYQKEAFTLAQPQRDTYRADRNRPCYHLIPSGKWMNEPHGPLFYDGWYHIFYQGNPHAPMWDHLCWGHLKSRDMVHWESMLPALIPEKEPTAPDGCWSGSSVIGKDGIPRIYFTAGNDRVFPNQAVALALPDDRMLNGWNSLPHLVQEQDCGWMGEFRDPFVWLEDNTYFMLVGTGDEHNGGGNAVLYSSDDGLSWQNHGFLLDYDFLQNTEVGHVWELPVLLPLKDESGTVCCHILLLCAAQIENEIVETYYFLGHWDAEKRTFTKHHEKARLLDLGKGIFTGPSGFVTPDGRSVVFTIAQGRRPFMDEIHAGWAHNGGLPVELSIRKGELSIQPIRELQTLRGAEIPVSCSEDLARHPGDALCLEYTAEGDEAAVILHFGEKQREIFYHRNTRHLGVRDETGAEIGRWRCHEDDVDIGGEDISFTCYLDRSMLEVYLNGRKAVSLRNYTEGSRYFRISGVPKALHLWEMESAYPEESK